MNASILFVLVSSTTVAPSYETSGLGLVVGGKLGAGLAQPFGPFGAGFVGELELGYLLPLLARSFELLGTASYRGPSATGEIADPRLPGPLVYTLSRTELLAGLGLIYRAPIPSKWVRPYVGVLGRASFLSLEIDAKAGDRPAGINEERRVDFGFGALAGAELYLGPGALLGELRFDHVPVDGFVLRDTNTSELGLAVGYRLFL